VAYADDFAIIFNRKYPPTLCDLMTAKLKILSEWTIAIGLGVSPSKTRLVLFTNRYKIPQLNPPILNNCNLSFSDHARYLGLALDKRLKWGLNNQEFLNTGLRRKGSDSSNYPDHRRRDLRSSHRSHSPKSRRTVSYSA